MSQASSASHEASGSNQIVLTGFVFFLAVIALTSANFLAILNTTIANVAVPSIAGDLGATNSQGTWVITSYAVGEAITVPLTGWLAARFGAVRVFAVAFIMFGVLSALCGVADSLSLLVLARVFQGFAGGPLMPLSQTLLMRIFPKEKAGSAIGLWSLTTLVAPVVGPILGGYLCDEYIWRWVFFINVPVALGFSFVAWKILGKYSDPAVRNPIDIVGLVLLAIWVAALQVMLDEGKNQDWFASHEIVALTIIAAIFFVVFVIWELYEKHPAVDLKVFRHRGFTASVLTLSLGYAAFFGVNVLTPLWMQNYMGYTATLAGFATMWTGVTAVLAAPIVSGLALKVDPRKLVFIGVIWLGIVTLWRTIATTDMGFWDIGIPLFVMGFALPLFFIPINSLALGSVEERETDSAAGLMNFLRTLSGAIATSMVTTSWSNKIIENHAELVGISDADGRVRAMLTQSGASLDAVNEGIDYLVTSQAVMLATNQLMMIIGAIFIVAAFAIWLAPRPTRVIEPGAGGH
jgi:DHA2 family multidrug resistance protein